MSTYAGRDACDLFFSIPELVAMVLHELPPVDLLVNCQRVNRLWNALISESHKVQQELFLEPTTPKPTAAGLHRQPVRMNPLLWECFGSVLAEKPKPFGRDRTGTCRFPCTNMDLAKLPMARDGQDIDAPARQRWARKDASWRKMLVSQPPIERLDWWHKYETWWQDPEDHATSKAPAPRESYDSGFIHQEQSGPVTLGMLWDLVEARLSQDCGLQVQYYPNGGSAQTDRNAFFAEKAWEAATEDDDNGYSTSLPRIKIQTTHSWMDAPAGENGKSWLLKTLPLDAGDGSRRWSKSNGFTWCPLRDVVPADS